MSGQTSSEQNASAPFGLPTRLGLCPVHHEEFYFPIGERDGTRCPQPGCPHELTVYVRVLDAEGADRIEEEDHRS